MHGTQALHLLALRTGRGAHEGGGEALEVVLAPLLGGVVVALGTLDLHREEDARGRPREVLGLTRVAQGPVHGPIHLLRKGGVSAELPTGEVAFTGRVHPGSGHHLAHDGVVAGAVLQCVEEPLAKRGPVDEGTARPLHEQIVEDVGEVARVVLAREQAGDGPLSLVRRRVGEKGGRDLRARKLTRQVEGHPPQEGRVVDVGARRHREGCPPLGQLVVCRLHQGHEVGREPRRDLDRSRRGRCRRNRLTRGLARGSDGREQ